MDPVTSRRSYTTFDTVSMASQEQEKLDNNTLDTVTLARQFREIQGSWEAEVSYGGEADLHRHLAACDKNPGHVDFIPADQFNIDYLPLDCHRNSLLDLVRALSDLTVRVTVTYISENRPEALPGTDKPYPCYNYRKSNLMRVGTGWVWRVRTYPHKNKKNTCYCKECVESSTPEIEFAEIIIHTAAHVVYDQLEGEHTTCHLFFDRGNNPVFCPSVITLSGMSSVEGDVERDWCRMTYVTHDIHLADKLNKLVSEYKQLLKRIKLNYSPTTTKPRPPSQAVLTDNKSQHLTIIVSHPHGCSKQVSVGYYTEIKKKECGLTSYTYTTATCPGSSGARVFVIGRDLWQKWAFEHSHCGNCEGNRLLNHSSFGMTYVPSFF